MGRAIWVMGNVMGNAIWVVGHEHSYFTTKHPHCQGVLVLTVFAEAFAVFFIRHGQFLPAFGAAAGQNSPSTLGGHSFQKTMTPGSFAFSRLISSLS